MNACARTMLAHEEAHNRGFNETIDRFIDQEKGEFQRGMLALKRTSAPSAAIAKARWEAGLVTIIAGAKRQLLSEIRAAIARIDSGPALTALAEAVRRQNSSAAGDARALTMCISSRSARPGNAGIRRKAACQAAAPGFQHISAFVHLGRRERKVCNRAWSNRRRGQTRKSPKQLCWISPVM